MPQAVASRYARALGDAVLAPNSGIDGRTALNELNTFDAMVRQTPELRNILMSPAVQASRKRAVVARFADMIPLSRLVRNLLYVLIDHHRTGMIDEVRHAFEAVLDERQGLVRAEVKSATALRDDQRNAIQGELSKITGKQVRCNFDVDPSLLGGVVARIGSTIYDGSVRAQLTQLRERLTAR